jgi:hypothetical protein
MSRSRQALNRASFRRERYAVIDSTIDEPITKAPRLCPGLVVIDTKAVAALQERDPVTGEHVGPPTLIDHWQLVVGPDGDDDGPRIVVTTRDEDLYHLALDVEGTGRVCEIVWHPSKRPDGSWVRLLDALRVTS